MLESVFDVNISEQEPRCLSLWMKMFCQLVTTPARLLVDENVLPIYSGVCS